MLDRERARGEPQPRVDARMRGEHRQVVRQEARPSAVVNGWFICDRGRYGFFYASQLDDNIPVALRPGWTGGTLGDDALSLARRLAELELAAEEGPLTPTQIAERDDLLRQLAGQ